MVRKINGANMDEIMLRFVFNKKLNDKQKKAFVAEMIELIDTLPTEENGLINVVWIEENERIGEYAM
jgi:hypothetical protein